jgi:hypothetical protein
VPTMSLGMPREEECSPSPPALTLRSPPSLTNYSNGSLASRISSNSPRNFPQHYKHSTLPLGIPFRFSNPKSPTPRRGRGFCQPRMHQAPYYRFALPWVTTIQLQISHSWDPRFHFHRVGNGIPRQDRAYLLIVPSQR